MRRSPLRPLVISSVLAASVLLSGCASTERASDTAVAPQHLAQPAPGEIAAEDGAVAADRALVTTGFVDLETADVSAARAEVEALALQYEGRVDARSETGGSRVSADLTLRVPAGDYDAFIEELRGVGEVISLQTSVVDQTLVQTDLVSRIASLESSVQALRTMLSSATAVPDLLAVETELTARESELRSLQSQLDVLEDEVAFSTITVTISSDSPRSPGEQPGGFADGFSSGLESLGHALAVLWTGLGFLLPGIVVLAVPVAAIWLGIRARTRLRRRRIEREPTSAPTRTSEPTPAGPHDDASEEERGPAR